MKPTKMSGPDNSVNQIPPWSVIEGDIRLTPFYTVEAAKAAVEGYIADINANITTFAEARGGYSKVFCGGPFVQGFPWGLIGKRSVI